MISPSFPVSADEFLATTMHLTDAESGLFMRLLCAQWKHGSLPDDDNELRLYGRGETPLERIRCLFERVDGRLQHASLEKHRIKLLRFKELQSKHGKKGGRPPIAPPKAPKPPKDRELPLDNAQPHKLFIDSWVAAFKRVNEFDYTFGGGRDAAAVKGLLSTKETPATLLAIAQRAWAALKQAPNNWNLKQSVTIHGFYSHLVAIRTELSNGTNQRNNRPNTGAEQRQLGIPTQPAKRPLGELLAESRRRAGQPGNPVAENPDRPGDDLAGRPGHGHGNGAVV